MNDSAPVQPIRNFPVQLFAGVMGLGGLSLAWRRAAAAWGLPAWTWQALLWLSCIAFVVVAGGYLAKLARFPQAVRADLTHPMRMVFVPTITISMLILAAGLADAAHGLASVLWWAGALGHLVATVYVIGTWFNRPDITRDAMTPAWLIPIVGNVVTPLAAPKVGDMGVAWFSFGGGVIFWLGLWPMLLNRILVHDNPLPPKLAPTLTIFLAPPSMIALSWQALTGVEVDPVVVILHDAAVFLSLLLCAQLHKLVKLPFALPVLAYTFPSAALASITVAMAGATGSGFHTAVATIALAAATLITLGAVGRVAFAAVRGDIFRPE